jgi:hypothetical protein
MIIIFPFINTIRFLRKLIIKNGSMLSLSGLAHYLTGRKSIETEKNPQRPLPWSIWDLLDKIPHLWPYDWIPLAN